MEERGRVKEGEKEGEKASVDMIRTGEDILVAQGVFEIPFDQQEEISEIFGIDVEDNIFSLYVQVCVRLWRSTRLPLISSEIGRASCRERVSSPV